MDIVRPGTPDPRRGYTPPNRRFRFQEFDAIQETRFINTTFDDVFKDHKVDKKTDKTTQTRLLAGYAFLCYVLIWVTTMVLDTLPYSFLLSSMQLLATSIGTYMSHAILYRLRRYQPTHCVHNNDWQLILYSLLFAWSIGLPNFSLAILPLPRHLSILSTTPLFTLILLHATRQAKLDLTLFIGIAAISMGTVWAAAGTSYDKGDFTVRALIISHLAAVTCAWFAIASHRLQVAGQRYAVLDLLPSVSLAAGVQMALWAYFNGEMGEVFIKFNTISGLEWCKILVCLVVAVVTNTVRMIVIDKVGPLALGVGGAIAGFDLLTSWNCIGFFLFSAGLSLFVCDILAQ